jgi:hypothetical protein
LFRPRSSSSLSLSLSLFLFLSHYLLLLFILSLPKSLLSSPIILQPSLTGSLATSLDFSINYGHSKFRPICSIKKQLNLIRNSCRQVAITRFIASSFTFNYFVRIQCRQVRPLLFLSLAFYAKSLSLASIKFYRSHLDTVVLPRPEVRLNLNSAPSHDLPSTWRIHLTLTARPTSLVAGSRSPTVVAYRTRNFHQFAVAGFDLVTSRDLRHFVAHTDLCPIRRRPLHVTKESLRIILFLIHFPLLLVFPKPITTYSIS